MVTLVMEVLDFLLCFYSWDIVSNVMLHHVLFQEEKEVLALLSRLDLQNLHFMNSSPGMLSNTLCTPLVKSEMTFSFFVFLMSIVNWSLNHLFGGCHVISFRKCRPVSSSCGG
jgi:hypothetical protein